MVKSGEESIKHSRRRKKKPDVIKLIDPEDSVLLLASSINGEGSADESADVFLPEQTTPERLTLSPVKVTDEVYRKSKKKAKKSKEGEGLKSLKQLKMSPISRKSRAGGSKRKISQSSDSEAEVGRTGLSENQTGTGGAAMDSCTLCLKEMTATEYRRHNRLPHDLPCTVELCPLRFSDTSDLQTHRRTAHFLANSKRKSWVASAEDQCPQCDKTFPSQKKLFNHQETVHGLCEGEQIGYPLQEIQPQETLADKEHTAGHSAQISRHLEQHKETELVKAKVEKKKRKSSSRDISDKPLVQIKVKTNVSVVDQINTKNDGKNEAFYARLDQENIKECPSCFHYFDNGHYDKHAVMNHEHPCRNTECKARFDKISYECIHAHRHHPDVKVPLRQPCRQCKYCQQFVDGKSIGSHEKATHSVQCPDCTLKFVVPTFQLVNHRVLQHILPLYSGENNQPDCNSTNNLDETTDAILGNIEAEEEVFQPIIIKTKSTECKNVSKVKSKTEDKYTSKPKNKRGRPAKQISTATVPVEESLEQEYRQAKEGSCEAGTSKGQGRRGRSISQDEVVHQASAFVNEKVSASEKKKRSRSDQLDEQINMKRNRGDDEEGRPVVKRELRRSQDTICHGIREIWTTPIKKEEIKSEQMSTINMADLQDFEISSTFDETAACSSSQNLQHSEELSHSDYQPSQSTLHTSSPYINQQVYGGTSFQPTHHNVTGEPGTQSSLEVQGVPSSFQINHDLLDLDFPCSSGSQSSEGSDLQSYYQSSQSLANITPLSSLMVVKPDPDIQPILPKKEQQSVPALSTQSRVPVCPLVPYAIDSESEMSSADDEASENIVATVSTSTAQSILKQELKDMEHKEDIKIEKGTNEDKEITDLFNEFSEEPDLDHLNHQSLSDFILQTSHSNFAHMDAANTISTFVSDGYQHKEVSEVNSGLIEQDTLSKDLVKKDIALKEYQSVINNEESFETETVEGDSKEELYVIAAPVIPNSTEIKYDTNEIDAIDIKHEKIDSSVVTDKSNASDTVKESKKISIKFNQKRRKSLASQIPESLAPVLDDLDFLTPVNQNQEQIQDSLLSKVHLFEESGVVEVFNKDEDVHISNNEKISLNEGLLPDSVDVGVNINKANIDHNISKPIAETVKVTMYKNDIKRGSFESEITGNEANHVDMNYELQHKSTSDINSLKSPLPEERTKPVIEDIKPILMSKHKDDLISEQIPRRPSVIMETRSLLDNCYSKPSSQVPDFAKMISSMPKIPKREKVVVVDNAKVTQPRKDPRDKKSKNFVKEEKIRQDKPKAVKENNKKEKDKKSKELMSPKIKEKARKKRGRPKKEDNKDNTELNFDFTAQLDDLEKSIREEENDEKDVNEENSERSLHDEKVFKEEKSKSDQSEIKECHQTLEDNINDTNVEISEAVENVQVIDISADSVTLESEEQSIEAIQELIKLGQASGEGTSDGRGVQGTNNKHQVIIESKENPSVTEVTRSHKQSVTEGTGSHALHSVIEGTSSHENLSVTEGTLSHDHYSVTEGTCIHALHSVTEGTFSHDHHSVTEGTSSHALHSVTEGTSSHENPSLTEGTLSHDHHSVTESTSSHALHSVTEGTSSHKQGFNSRDQYHPRVSEGTSCNAYPYVTEGTSSLDHLSVTQGTSNPAHPNVTEGSRSHKQSVSEITSSHKHKVQNNSHLFYDSSDDELGKFSPIPMNSDNEELEDGYNQNSIQVSYSTSRTEDLNDSSAKAKDADVLSAKAINTVSFSTNHVTASSSSSTASQSSLRASQSSAALASVVDLTASPQAAGCSRSKISSATPINSSSSKHSSSPKENNDDIEVINVDSSPSKKSENMESISAFITSSTSYDDRFVMTPNDTSKISDGIIDDLLAESDEDDGVLAEKWDTTTNEDTAPSSNIYYNPSNDRQPSSSLSYACLPIRHMSENLRSLALESSCLNDFGAKQPSSSGHQRSSEVKLPKPNSVKEESKDSLAQELSKILKPESPKSSKKSLKIESPKSSRLELPKFSKVEFPKSLSPAKSFFSPCSSSSPVCSPRPHHLSPGKKKKRKKSSANREKCPICELEMKTGAEYSTHIKQDHSKACIYCPLKFTYNHGLEDHIASQHNAEADIHNSCAWHCSKCGKNFNREKVFLKHLALDHKHKCTIKKCKMAYVFSADLSEHNANSHKKGKTEKIKVSSTDTSKIQSNTDSIKSQDTNIFSPKSGSPLINANLKSFTIPKNTTKTNADLSDAQNKKAVVVETGGDTSNLSEICELCQSRMTMEDFMEHIDLDHNFNCSDDKCGLSFTNEDSKLEHEFQAHGLQDHRGSEDELVATVAKQGYTTASGGISSSINQSALKSTSDSDINGMLEDGVHQDDKAKVGDTSAEANDSHNSSLSLSCDEWETDMMRKMREEKTCFLCDQSFQNQGDYERHMAYDHEDEYTVPADNKDKHQPQHDNSQSPGDEVKVPIQKCHLCEQSTDDILKHLHTFHDKTKQVSRDNHGSCRQCEAKFSNTIEYLKHSEIKHKYPCKNCKLTFTKDVELTAHTAAAHEAATAGSSRKIAAGALTCEQCGHEMNNRNLYDRHMVKVHSIYCTQLDCNHMFVTHQDLKDHLTNIHLVRYIQIGDKYEAKLIPGRSKKNAVIMPKAENWISSKKALDRMRAITRGEFESTRHELFFDRKEREQCNGQNASNLNNMANGSFFREFDEMETKILAQIKEQVVEPMIKDNTADHRLIDLFNGKDLGSSYTNLVLCPEIFVYLYEEQFKMSRGEAENQFLEIHTDKETLESIKKGTYGQESDSSKQSTPAQSDEEEDEDDF